MKNTDIERKLNYNNFKQNIRQLPEERAVQRIQESRLVRKAPEFGKKGIHSME